VIIISLAFSCAQRAYDFSDKNARAAETKCDSHFCSAHYSCVKSAGYFPRVHSALSTAINLLQTTFSDFLHRSTETQKMPLAAGVAAAADNKNTAHISRQKQMDDENE
jgi:hypothetical protein